MKKSPQKYPFLENEGEFSQFRVIVLGRYKTIVYSTFLHASSSLFLLNFNINIKEDLFYLTLLYRAPKRGVQQCFCLLGKNEYLSKTGSSYWCSVRGLKFDSRRSLLSILISFGAVLLCQIDVYLSHNFTLPFCTRLTSVENIIIYVRNERRLVFSIEVLNVQSNYQH